MRADLEIEHCRWCMGDGRDHGTLGMPLVRDCTRCEGSGRVYVTSRESATGRRRVYKGAAPKPGMAAARHQQELTETLRKPKRASRRKDGRSHAA